MSLINKIKTLLDKYDSSNEQFSELDIDAKIIKIKPEDPGHEFTPIEYIAEQIAFSFREGINHDESRKNYKPNFKPMRFVEGDDGNFTPWPADSDITEEILNYWALRSQECKNHILKSRYAGLVCHYKKFTSFDSTILQTVQTRINSAIHIAKQNLHTYPSNVFAQLDHALFLAIKINNADLIENTCNAIINYEKMIRKDNKNGYWGSAFDRLYSNKKAKISEEQRQALLQDLEERLESFYAPSLSTNSSAPWGAIAIGKRLADQYRKESKPQESLRILKTVKKVILHIANISEPTIAQDLYKKIEKLFRLFGFNDEASVIRVKIKDIGDKVRESMKPIEFSMEVSNEEMEKYVKSMICGTIDEAKTRFIFLNIPRRDATIEQLQRLSDDFALTYTIPKTFVDSKGRPVSKINSIQQDIDGHVVAQTSQNMTICSIYINAAIKYFINEYQIDPSKIMSWIENSPIFTRTSRKIIKRGLEAYFSSDHIVFIHLLIPQIENAIRELVDKSGKDVYRPNRNGGMDLRQLDDLLRDKTVIKSITPDCAEYFRILFTDKRGFNLRNKTCHGMMNDSEMNSMYADRVFHSFIILSNVTTRHNQGLSSG